MSYFADNVKFLRKKRKMSQDEMLAAVGFQRTTWASYELKKSEPSIDGIIRIARFFSVSIEDLVDKKIEDVQVNEISIDEKNDNFVKGNVKEHVKLNPDIQENWLMDQKGRSKLVNMPQKDANTVRLGMPKVITLDTSGEENSVLVPVRARAGYLAGYGDPEYIKNLPAFKIWGSTGRTYRIFEIEGNSMFNTLHDGDKAKAYWVGISEVRDGRIYVVVTKNEGLLIKRVINRYQEGKLILKSDNNHKGEYPPIVLDIHDINELWYVDEYSSHMMGEPGEWYNRMLQLEADVIMLKDKLLKS